VTEDAARALVRADPRVRDDPVAFQLAILSREVAAYDAAIAAGGTVFFDRAIPDVAAAFAVLGLAVPAEVTAAARDFRYAPTVFVAPPWREIYVNDAERVQPYEHAVAVHAAITGTYARYGYDVVALPRASVEGRVAFVLARADPGQPGSS
jgi:predicted ATPase